MADLGKTLVVLGVVLGTVLVVGGLVLVLFGRSNVPLGRLPGDIVWRGKNTTFYFPLATSILLSLVISGVLYFLGRFRR